MSRYSEQKQLEDLNGLIEDTFDLCVSNKDEIYWLICLLRGLMNVPNKNRQATAENYKINLWQYQLHPIIEKYKKKYKNSNY